MKNTNCSIHPLHFFKKLLILFGCICFSMQESISQNYNFPATGLQGTKIGACPITVSSGNFFDNGGSGGNYLANVNQVEVTYSAATAGQCLQVAFTSFSINDTYFLCFGPNNCCDYLEIFDGPSSTGTLLYRNCTVSPGTITSTTGSLTFRFTSDGTLQLGGWAATFSTVTCAGGQTSTSNSDCVNATSMYASGIFANTTTGLGIVAEGCVDCFIGENYSHWYTFTVATSGTLGFTIDPSNNSTDFDFALFPANANCGSLGTPLRCSRALVAGGGNTGLGNNAVDNSEGISGDQWVAPINVVSGQTYKLLINTYSANNTGFTFTFSGTADIQSATSTTWNGSTWSNGSPNSSSDAVIASSIAPSSFTCKSLIIGNGESLNITGITASINGDIINNGNGISGSGIITIANDVTISGNALTIPSGSRINVTTGTLTTGGLLRIASGGAIVGNYNNINGLVTLEKNIIGQRGWRMFANPFSSIQTFSSIATNNGITIGTSNGVAGIADVRIFNSSNNQWANAGLSTTTNTAYGLFIRGLSSEVTGSNYTAGPSAFTYSVSGTLNDNSVSFTPANTSNYFIVGNPYAAPVNTQALTGGVSRGYVTYQITQGGSQTAQRTRAGSWIVAGGNSSTNSTLPVLGTLAFIPSSTNSFNVTNSNINIFGTPVTNLFSTNNEIQQIGISIEQSGQLLDRIYIRQEANNNERLPKFKNDIVNFYIQTTDDKALSIESKAKLFGKHQLAISAPKGNYQLSINHNSLPANITTTLVDNYLQTETKLIANAVYNFTINNDSISQGNKRFYVVFTNSNMASVIEEMPIAKAFKAVVVANVNNTKIINIYLENAQNNQAQVLVRDVLGRTISSNYISNGTNSIIAPNTKGIYIIEINDGIHKQVKKIIQ